MSNLKTHIEDIKTKLDSLLLNTQLIIGGDHSRLIQDGLRVSYKAIDSSGSTLVDTGPAKLNGSLSGSYTKNSNNIAFSGGYGLTGNINSVQGTFEIVCSVNSNFTPCNSSAWYSQSSVFGREIGEIVRDWAIVLQANTGYYQFGYGGTSADMVKTTNIKANTGLVHYLAVIKSGNRADFYIDGELKATATDVKTSGTIPDKYGIMWSDSNSSSITQGAFYMFQYYNRSLSVDEIRNNYKYYKSHCGIK